MPRVKPSDRLPPCSEEAERGALGSILLDATRVMHVVRTVGISEEAFYVPAHRLIWGAIDYLSQRGMIVDVLTVTQQLADDGDLESAGGATACDRLCDATPTAAHAEYYIDIVMQKWTLRKVIAAARATEEAAYDVDSDGEAVEQVRADAELAMAQIKRTDPNRRTKRQVLLDQCGRWRAARESGTAGIRTGISLLDNHWGGLMEQGFYIVSGAKKSCKTTLCRQIGMHVAETEQVPTGFFTLEVSEDMLVGSIGALWAQQSVYFLNSGKAHLSSVEAVEAMADRLDRMPLYIDDRPQDAASLWSNCKHLVGKYGVKLIIVDYLQKIRDGNQRFKNIDERVTHQSDTLYAIAKALRISILAVAAVNSDGEVRGSRMAEYDVTASVRLSRSMLDTGEINPKESDLVHIDFVNSRWSPPVGRETMRLNPDGYLVDLEKPPAQDDLGFMDPK